MQILNMFALIFDCWPAKNGRNGFGRSGHTFHKHGTKIISALIGLSACLSVSAPLKASADEPLTFFRIGTGPTATTSYALGTAISIGISKPPGAPACGQSGLCGVPGLIAVAQTRQSALETIQELASGELESALIPGDIAYWAYHGGGPFGTGNTLERLRVIANMASFTMHIVADASLNLRSVQDLAGLRLSLGSVDSAARQTAETILKIHGLPLDTIEDAMLGPGPSADALISGQIDAFFLLGSGRLALLDDVSETVPISLIPIAATERERLLSAYPFVVSARIPAGYYGLETQTQSIGVNIKWVTTSDQPNRLVRDITRAVWSGAAAEVYHANNPGDAFSERRLAILSGGVPMHEGAKAYYTENPPIAGQLE